MIPTREQIDVSNGILCAMSDEINRLTAANERLTDERDRLRVERDEAGKMVPVLYWLEDGKFARAMLVGKDLLVVDLTFGDGPSVVGKPEWFEAGYVAAYGGLVPESATRGKEPGQWDYGVASIAKPAAAVPDHVPDAGKMVPDDTRELVAQLADLVAWAMPTMNHHKGVKAIAAKLRGGA